MTQSLRELLSTTRPADLKDGQEWGHWKFYGESGRAPMHDGGEPLGLHFCLAYHNAPGTAPLYYIDLDRCESGAAICDWIFQVPELYRQGNDAGDLLTALNALLSPQQFFCSSGVNMTADVRAVIQYNVSGRKGKQPLKTAKVFHPKH